MTAKDIFLEAVKKRDNGGSNREKKGIRYLTPEMGTTKFMFVGDLDKDPKVLAYKSYTIPNFTDENGKFFKFKTFRYVDGDPIHPRYLEFCKEEGRNPHNFSSRTIGYVFNISGYLGHKKSKEGKKLKPDENTYFKSTKYEADDFDGVMILDSGAGITAGIGEFLQYEVDNGNEDPSLQDYSFTLNRSNSGGRSSYVLTMDEPRDDLPDEIVSKVQKIMDGGKLFGLEDRLERMRYKGGEEGELEEKFKVSTLSENDDDTDDSTPTVEEPSDLKW